MGLRGPQPKPASEARRTGKPRRRPPTDQQRAMDTPARKRSPDEFPAPGYLSPRAQELWQHIMPELVEQDLMSEGRIPTLVMLVNSFVDYAHLRGLVEQGGWIEGDGQHKNPAVDMMLRVQQIYLALARDFGLTPKSKAYQPARREKAGATDLLAEWKGDD